MKQLYVGMKMDETTHDQIGRRDIIRDNSNGMCDSKIFTIIVRFSERWAMR